MRCLKKTRVLHVLPREVGDQDVADGVTKYGLTGFFQSAAQNHHVGFFSERSVKPAYIGVIE